MTPRKTERLLNLVFCLLSTRRYLSAEAIRASVPQYADAPNDDAFKRMFERDKEELRGIGIPLETGTDGWDDEIGYRVSRRDYELPEIALAPDEAAAVGLAARAWHDAALSEAAQRGLQKLRAAGVEPEAEPLPGLEPRVEATEPAFAPMLDAVQGRYPVRFDYRRPGETAPITRRLEPWGAVSWHGRWYVVGHDRDRDAARVFRLGRVVGPVRRDGQPGSVTVPDDVDLVAQVVDTGPETPSGTARLRIRAGRAGDLRRDGEVVGPAEDGELVELAYADEERLADRLVGYGADVVVEEPAELREAVVRRLRAVLAVHGG